MTTLSLLLAQAQSSVARPFNPITGVYGQGRLTLYAAPGTYSFVARSTSIRVRLWGGGAKGPDASNSGAGGGFALKVISGLTIGNTYTVTVGGVGGTSSFAALLSAPGGSGATPGAGVGGDLNYSGGAGITATAGCGGAGAANVFGNGGAGNNNGTSGGGGSGSQNGGSGFSGQGGISGDASIKATNGTSTMTFEHIDYIGTGGGGGANATTGNAGGSGVNGGGAGGSSNSVAGSAGGFPGGGGGAGANGGTGGAGGTGMVLIED